jgi:hypothetical protein
MTKKFGLSAWALIRASDPTGGAACANDAKQTVVTVMNARSGLFIWVCLGIFIPAGAELAIEEGFHRLSGRAMREMLT